MRVSPRLTLTWSAAVAWRAALLAAGVVVLVAAAPGAAAGAGAGLAAGPFDGATAVMGATVCFAARPGGSSSMVYSRTSRPEPQFSSTSISMKGSFTGRLELTFRTALPFGFFSTVKRRDDN